MKLKEIKVNPDNPQKFNDLSKLENSIKEFPKMMELRPLVYDPETMQVLGGNKRLICLQNLGYKDIPDTWVLSAEDLTDEEKQRFIIADNVGFGQWDWDKLDNWEMEDLEEWGLELPDNLIEQAQEGDEIKIEQSLQVLPKNEYIIIYAQEDSDEWNELKSIFKCKTVRQGGCKIGSTSDKATTGLERVFNIKTFKERVGI